MRTLIFATATSLGLFCIPAWAVPITCNTAVQNWQNGSQNTCPYGAGNAAAPVEIFVPQYTPPVIYEDVAVEVEDDD